LAQPYELMMTDTKLIASLWKENSILLSCSKIAYFKSVLRKYQTIKSTATSATVWGKKHLE